MKKILLVPLLVIFFVGCCGLLVPKNKEEYTPVVENPVMKTCDDLECMNESFQTCEPAKYEMTQNGTTILSEIRGTSSSGKCVVYIKIVTINQTQVPENMRFLVSNVEGKDMVCALSQSEIDNLKNGQFEKNMLSNCEGPLKDIIQLFI